jgi:hypothetical protein
MAHRRSSARAGTGRRSAVLLGAVLALLTTTGCGDARTATTTDSGGRDAGAADTSEPDADATGGDTLDAGADADAGGSNSCVSVTGGGVEPWLNLQIVGRRFDAYEGRRIRIVVACQAGWRLGVAAATIANGAFALTIPATFNHGCYTEIALYVDDDTDDACDAGEPLWGFVTGIVQENLLVEATPDGPCLSGGGPSMSKGCRLWLPPAGPCAINFQADLETRLPCPPQAAHRPDPGASPGLRGPRPGRRGGRTR